MAAQATVALDRGTLLAYLHRILLKIVVPHPGRGVQF